MASSRLFIVLGYPIIRNSRKVSRATSLKFNDLLPSLPFKRYTCSAVSSHPWPEWVNFVDGLKDKGYLTQIAAPSENDGGADDEGLVVYTEMKLVKDACLSFARDRFDIFRSLSTQDVQTVVEKGCPKLFRKAVNSAKRLRAYIGLDEGDVCRTCNLCGSCDRAYVMLNDSEAAARTVDIVRILLLYALDPLFISEENKSPGRELVESSVRKLLLQLTELGETYRNPDLLKRASIISQRKKQPLDLPVNESSKDIEMKQGDWVCTKCNFMNFARNIRCLKCEAERPKSIAVDKVEMKKGDWNCPQQKKFTLGIPKMGPGHSRCSFMNFASNRQCLRCQGQRPHRQLRPGDWECPE
ncbi:zinc finger protein var3 chloroplastic [Phtheirospermum japonicum]|uniref:Zinc finger protein var3 chloroplastic n=1 Tax=Phtheirospermum japonicum TaxID=374723 RepID=A0A830BHN8_9LAMI|nr:zinc finger protein var3 chloroplastic [Phtheirospermum japonicum]